MIHKLIKYLKSKTIDYVVTNGYEDLFIENLKDNDIDILFRKRDFLTIEKILKSFCDDYNFKIVQIYHQEVYAKNIFIYNPENQQILNLDISNSDYFIDGYVDSNRLNQGYFKKYDHFLMGSRITFEIPFSND